MEEMTTLKSIRFVNRDLLKYVALFLMVTGHLLIFNLLTSIAMIMILEQNGKTREEAENEVSEGL